MLHVARADGDLRAERRVYTVDITVSNNTAGVTTASVKVRTEAD